MSLKNDIQKKEKITITGAVLSFIIFSAILHFSNFSVSSIVDIQNYILKTILLQSAGTNTIGAISVLLSPFAWIFIAMLFFVLGLAFLSAYGYYNINKSIGLICGIIGAVFVLVLLNLSIISIFFAVSLIICGMYIISLSNTYGKELKKWVFFRVGSHAISKILLITNILIAIGIFIAIFANIPVYENNFKTGITESMTTVAMASIPKSQDYLYNESTKQKLKQELSAAVEKSISDSPIFNAYVRWLPVTSAVTIWVLLEFLRSLIFSNIGGGFTAGIIRILKRYNK